MNKSGIIFLVILSILMVVAVSGCTDSSTISNKTKHFDNGMFSFDYPADHELIGGNNSGSISVALFNNPGVLISSESFSPETFDVYVNDKAGAVSIISKKFTVDGKDAYNTSYTFPEGEPSINTYIYLGNGTALIITPQYKYKVNTTDPTSTDSYKTYTMILNTLKIQ
jgi:hypothetical protein